jgi:Berberine and berberine like
MPVEPVLEFGEVAGYMLVADGAVGPSSLCPNYRRLQQIKAKYDPPTYFE